MVKRAAQQPKTKKAPLKRQKAEPALLAVMKPEKKNFDTEFLNATAGDVVPLHLVELGALNNQRVGNKISISNINLRINISAQGLVGTRNIRIVVFVDHQCNGALPLIGDLFSPGAILRTFRNPNQLPRFTVLSDVVHEMARETGAGTSGAAAEEFHTVSKAKLNIPILFNNTTNPTLTSAIKTNGVYFFCSSNVPENVINFNCRIKYYDA